ncbi:MAG TPA: hypothetical protein DCZ30_07460 [Clostridiales bacterium]|nr:hypothetical protein [Clostridiales bacterium]
MMGKVLVDMIIIPAVIFTLASGITHTSLANEDKNKTEYVISQSEESKFLEDIYKTEKDNLKIKSIDKKVSDQNYIDKEITETKTLNKSDEDYIRNQFGETKDFNDGTYKGTLSISNIDIQTIKNGYYEKIDEQVLSFENFTDNDLNNIEKEIDINNVKYYLINVEWEPENTRAIDNENVPTTYKGRKIYQTVKTLAYSDTYKVTVTYTGKAEKVDTVYDYKVNYEKKVQEPQEEPKQEEKQDSKGKQFVLVSGIGLTAILMYLLNGKNTYIYAKNNNGFKLIKTEKISDKKVSIDISNCYRSSENIYAIKINPLTFKRFKGRTISIVQGNKKKDIVLWNNYYEIKL